MEDLIKQLEAATEGSADLDDAVWRALYLKQEAHTALQFTRSLDAALTLVDGRNWSIGHLDFFGASVWPERSWTKGCRGATPALALCIAALKARAE